MGNLIRVNFKKAKKQREEATKSFKEKQIKATRYIVFSMLAYLALAFLCLAFLALR